MSTPALDDWIYFDESTWGTSTRLRLKYFHTGASNNIDQWSYYINGSLDASRGIQVDISSGVWSDWGSNAPYTVYNEGDTDSDGNVVANGKIRFFDQNGNVHTFTNPYATSGGGGGTSTEGSSEPSGSFYFNSQNQLVFVISSAFLIPTVSS